VAATTEESFEPADSVDLFSLHFEKKKIADTNSMTIKTGSFFIKKKIKFIDRLVKKDSLYEGIDFGKEKGANKNRAIKIRKEVFADFFCLLKKITASVSDFR